jgi:hypothetical protein
MAMNLNGKNVLLSGSALVLAGERLDVLGSPSITMVEVPSATTSISVVPAPDGFALVYGGFAPGQRLANEAKGTWGTSAVLIRALVERVAELNGSAYYRIDYFVAYD